MSNPALIQLSPCTIIRVSGPDSFRFLNGQLTNDIALATTNVAIHAAALNAKGGLEAVCWVKKIGDDFLLDAPLELRETIMERLDRYLIADDVTLTDESDDWTLVHQLSSELSATSEKGESCEASRFGTKGLDIWAHDSTELPKHPSYSADQILDIRITKGIPAWGAELTTGMLPPEAGLQATAISYEKGCYLGQEVISRMKWAGKTNRHLVRLEVPSGTKSGTEFLSNGVVAGSVTSISPFCDSTISLALGYRKRKFEEQDSFVLSGNEDCVRVTARLS